MVGDFGEVTFAAPWGLGTRIITLAILSGMFALTSIALSTVELPIAAKAALISAPLLIVVVTAPFMILGYELRQRTLIIKRPGWTTRIPLDGLRAATPNPAALRYSIRIFGNGGLFAFNGLFWNNALGRYRAYVTDAQRSVVLNLADRTIVISPDSPQRFLSQLGAQHLLPATRA